MVRTRSQAAEMQSEASTGAAVSSSTTSKSSVAAESDSQQQGGVTWMLPKYWKRLFQSFRPNISTQRDFKQILLDGTAHVHLNVNDLRKVAQELQRILAEEGRLEDASAENFKGIKVRISAMIQHMILKMPSKVTTPTPATPGAPPGKVLASLAMRNAEAAGGGAHASPALACTPPSMHNRLADIQSTIPQPSTRTGTSSLGAAVLGQKRDRGIVIPESATTDTPETLKTSFTTTNSSAFPSHPAVVNGGSRVVGLSLTSSSSSSASSIPFANKDPNSCFPVQGLKGFEPHCSPLLPVVVEIKRMQVRLGTNRQQFEIPPFLTGFIQSRRCRIIVFPVRESFIPSEWPLAKNSSVFVNDEMVTTPWKRAWARKDVCPSYLSLDITNLLPAKKSVHRFQIDNHTVSVPPNPPDLPRTFVIAVCVKLEVGEVGQHLLNRYDARGLDVLRNFQYPIFASCRGAASSSVEDDVQETTLASMTTKCPISHCPITVPVRGHQCEHIQPIDLSSYLVSTTTLRFTNCPLCDKVMRMSELVIDRPLFQGLRGWGTTTPLWPQLQLYHPNSTVDPLEGARLSAGGTTTKTSPSLSFLAQQDSSPFNWMRAIRQRQANLLEDEDSSSDEDAQSPPPPSGPPLVATAPPRSAPPPPSSNQPEIIELD